ncbi:MAG: Hsp70 family protein, partial [Planctomycetota bacterium]
MSHRAVGIDLGTTYSALAVINPAGRPEIVANAEGERITASAVFFQKDGSVLVGQDAADSAGGFPDRVVRWVKREVGKSDWKFEVDGNTYSAVDISSLVLRKVKQDAEAVLGPIKYAVVTVPAYFDEYRRKATMDAARAAGLDLLRIINEPTAAAIAYAATGQLQGNLLVYDFGGGTFDVSVVRVNGADDVQVIASEGDHDLGGFTLDSALAAHYDHVFAEAKGRSVKEDHGAWHALLQQAERDKCALSRRTQIVGVPLQGYGQLVNASIDRATMESLIADPIVRTEMLVDNALAEAKMRTGDIDGILLVGGSTRIPAVRAMLEKKFGQPPITGVNPDEAVALGAAIQAGVLMEEQGLSALPEEAKTHLSRTRIRDVTNHSFGTL